MFFTTDHLLPQLWLTLLSVVWAGFLFGGFGFGSAKPPKNQRISTWARISSSLVLVVAAWSWHLYALNTPAERFSLLIAVGMTLGWVGDLFMAKLLPFWPEPTIGGMLAFGLGHVAYIVAFVQFGNDFHLNQPAIFWGAWLFWLLIGLAGWYIVVKRGQKMTVLHWGALPYSLLLASTAGIISGVALQQALFLPAAIGAALFLSSDLLIAVQLFNSFSNRFQIPLISDLIWLTYGPAQLLIVYSVDSTLRIH
jgi:hypothetical protein